jgi:erythromycin esterase-like protein
MNRQFLIDQIRKDAIEFRSNTDLDPVTALAGKARFALLGEASHGTSEFYTVRAELSKRLITEHGFRFIAVEGDWPSCYAINQYVKRLPSAPATVEAALSEFTRWPSWMWANEEIADLAEWLREYNDGVPEPSAKVGFYGIDVYSLWESLEEIIAYLERNHSPTLEQAKEAMACFESHQRDEQSYAVAASFLGEDCKDEVVDLLVRLREERQATHTSEDHKNQESALSVEINALVGVNAEKYYRTMVRGDAQSWNVRDHHMVEALGKIAAFYGADSKGIVWEHNTHIGDARATDMAREDMVNVGQLVREQYGMDQIYAVGFGTYRGTVVAGSSWGAPPEVMTVPPATQDSWEHCMHEAGAFDKLLLLHQNPEPYRSVVPHRAIGVVYHPGRERFGNYVPSNMAERYDAFIHIEETKALRPVVAPVREPVGLTID